MRSSQKNQDEIFWYQGTLHHVFDGGWMWVIPFNNHQRSTNPICSVGVNFDSRRFPKTNLSAEKEFQNFLTKFPDIAIQFEDAKPIRNWVSTGRLQYSSSSCRGERFFLLPHAAGFVDALYSFGLVNTCTIIVPLAARIMKAIGSNNYTKEHFADLENLQQKLFDYNDNLVNCSYIAFSDYNLWDAWRRIWILGSSMRQWKAGVQKSLKINAGKAKELSTLDFEKNLDYLTPSFEGLGDRFFSEATAIVEKFQQSQLSANEAAQKIMSAIEVIDFLPPNYLGLADVANKDLDVASEFGSAEQKRFLFLILLRLGMLVSVLEP
ncbi:hypothetical protein IQ238_21715 [Pleurocapsales cyanobacterium LEGE 06147]|nr:hypothetical protein [Pleurocapsales cyanobacterium LEGE 06147]